MELLGPPRRTSTPSRNHGAGTQTRDARRNYEPRQIERLLWVVENFFQHDEGSGPTHPIFLTPTHELGFYYLCRFPQHSPLYEQDTFLGDENGHTLIFKWFPITALETCPFYPAFLRKDLQSPPAHPTHVCIREGTLAPSNPT